MFTEELLDNFCEFRELRANSEFQHIFIDARLVNDMDMEFIKIYDAYKSYQEFQQHLSAIYRYKEEYKQCFLDINRNLIRNQINGQSDMCGACLRKMNQNLSPFSWDVHYKNDGTKYLLLSLSENESSNLRDELNKAVHS